MKNSCFYNKFEMQYLLLEEQKFDPYRSHKSKNFFRIVMFIAAIARPIFDQNRLELFSVEET